MKLLILLGAITMAMGFPFGVPEYVRTSLGDSIDKSTMKVLKEAYASAANKNVVSSPLGLMTLLSLYNSGAGDATKVELNQFLGGSDHRELSNSYSVLSQQLANLDPSYLTLANKIYIGNGLTPTNQFAATARDYRSEVESIDFTKPADAAKIINKWSDEKTQGNIKDPVSPDALSPDVVAALVNVIFFKGHWHVPFSAKETKEKDFNIDTKTKVKKPMMHLLQSLFYTESSDLGARLIELPYKEYGFRMVVVLPNEVDGLPSVLEKAADKGLLSDVFELSPAGRDIDLDIPKFEVRSKLDFNDILPKVGVSKIFDEAATGIVNGLPVKVSKAFQEAFIKVDEEGATAGAFTGVVAVLASADSTPPTPMQFTVDRPFLYAILYEDKILFVGTYTQ